MEGKILEIGARVYVDAEGAEGPASIIHIEDGEIYPVQVEMDEPRDTGGRVYRVTWSEVSKEVKTDTGLQVSFEDRHDTQKYIGRCINVNEFDKRHGYAIGEEFTLGVPLYPGAYQGGHPTYFYVYEMGNLKALGSRPSNKFQVIGIYDPKNVPKQPKSVPKEHKVVQIPLKASAEPTKAVEKAKKVESEQLSLF